MSAIRLSDIITISLTLFAIIDVLGNVPVIISMKNRGITIQPVKTTIFAGILMVSFLFLGDTILSLLGLDTQSFALAGSVVIFLLGLEMILGIRIYRDEEASSASIVPIAFPLIAGAGTMTTLLSLRSQYHAENIVIAIILNVILVYAVLKSSSKIEKMLGKTGLGVVRKAFGVVLLAIAVKLFAANVKGLFI